MNRKHATTYRQRQEAHAQAAMIHHKRVLGLGRRKAAQTRAKRQATGRRFPRMW